MKKLGLVLGLGLLSTSSLFADYQLTLIDKDGTETKQCIKSYSFSNNLESLARKNAVGLKDVYSEEETMTNKVYFGRPVYRKVFLFDDFSVPYSKTETSKWTPVISEEIDSLVSLSFKGYSGTALISENDSRYAIYSSGVTQLIRAAYDKDLKKGRVVLRQGVSNFGTWSITDLSITVEYTKTTDETNSSSNTFKSYLHYVPSSSTDEEVITKDMKNLGIQFLEGYTYDSSTDSCTKE